MASTPNPYNNPTGWDKIIIGDIVWPGIVQSVNIPTSLNYEVVRKRGNQGSRIRYKGREPRSITVDILINSNDDEGFDDLEEIKKDLYLVNPAKKTIKPQKVSHPKINSYGINTVWYTGYDEGYHSITYGTYITITLIENTDDKQFEIDVEPTQTGNNKKKKGVSSTTASTSRDPATGIVEAI